MSNQQVGTVYQQIIADVVESSRVDFEEGGVDEHVLEELRMVGSISFLPISSCLPLLSSSFPYHDKAYVRVLLFSFVDEGEGIAMSWWRILPF
jgi:hypothetical protein